MLQRWSYINSRHSCDGPKFCNSNLILQSIFWKVSIVTLEILTLVCRLFVAIFQRQKGCRISNGFLPYFEFLLQSVISLLPSFHQSWSLLKTVLQLFRKIWESLKIKTVYPNWSPFVFEVWLVIATAMVGEFCFDGTFCAYRNIYNKFETKHLKFWEITKSDLTFGNQPRTVTSSFALLYTIRNLVLCLRFNKQSWKCTLRKEKKSSVDTIFDLLGNGNPVIICFDSASTNKALNVKLSPRKKDTCERKLFQWTRWGMQISAWECLQLKYASIGEEAKTKFSPFEHPLTRHFPVFCIVSQKRLPSLTILVWCFQNK